MLPRLLVLLINYEEEGDLLDTRGTVCPRLA
jgi:hypothetical protein